MQIMLFIQFVNLQRMVGIFAKSHQQIIHTDADVTTMVPVADADVSCCRILLVCQCLMVTLPQDLKQTR